MPRVSTSAPRPTLLAWGLLLSLGLAGTACQPPAESERTESVDEQAVRDTLATLARQFSRAYVAGDADAMTALYTDDAVLLPHNATEVRGREAIRAYWAPQDGQAVTEHRITPLEVEVRGDVATDYGTYVASGTVGDEAWGPSYGNYLIVWERGDDGRWRMQLDMWNGRPAPTDSEG